jgi:protein phosphatase
MLRVTEHFERTDRGRARRGNEDALYARAPVFVVADGMGGAQAGEVASGIAIEAFRVALGEQGSPEERLAGRAREANRRIHELAVSDRAHEGMGTTLTAAYVGEREVAVAHVGDSRAYLLRDGELQRLTRDHSLVQALIDDGRLTEAEAPNHPQRSVITRALGPESEVEVETRTYAARAGDLLLLCSDGLTSMVDEQRMAEILRAPDGLAAAGGTLIDTANAAGGKDNITVVLFRLEEISEAGAGAPADAAPATEQTRTMPAVPSAEARPASTSRSTQIAGRDPAPAPASAGSTVVIDRASAEEARAAHGARAAPPKRAPLSGHRRVIAAAIAAGVVIVALVIAGYLATQELYFVGTTPQGMMAVYRGLPYSLGGGVNLYNPYYITGVPARDLRPARRRALLNHHLRSHSDVVDLVNALERGRLAK